jgi:heptosyltransferase-2
LIERLAVVKPDHVGDLVLASPAIAWLRRQVDDVTLFVRPELVTLAAHLFPGLPIMPLALAHLDKEAMGTTDSLRSVLLPLREFGTVVVLRADEVLNPDRIGHLVGPSLFTFGRDDVHEATTQRTVLRGLFGDYLPSETWPGKASSFPMSIRAVGLCPASGFPANKWSVIRWVELGRQLLAEGMRLILIGGSRETGELAILARVLGLDSGSVVVGGDNLTALLSRVAEADLVIASDGGGGHLCSLAAPVLSIAGAVPFRRYAPFGAETRVVSLDLPCSPCLAAHHKMINACFSHECGYGIRAEHVMQALRAPVEAPGAMRPLADGAKLFYAPSHA